MHKLRWPLLRAESLQRGKRQVKVGRGSAPSLSMDSRPARRLVHAERLIIFRPICASPDGKSFWNSSFLPFTNERTTFRLDSPNRALFLQHFEYWCAPAAIISLPLRTYHYLSALRRLLFSLLTRTCNLDNYTESRLRRPTAREKNKTKWEEKRGGKKCRSFSNYNSERSIVVIIVDFE